MHRSILRSILPGVVLALVAAPGAGAPSGPDTIPLRLEAPSPTFDAAGEGSSVVPRLSGFGASSRPGEPMLPLKVLLVAIPEGSIPELRILSAPFEPLPGLRVAPVPRLRVRDRGAQARAALIDRKQSAGRSGTGPIGPAEHDFAPDPAVYGRDAEFPDAPVRLGSIGYMREQRFVEVIFTPVTCNPSRREARYFPEVRAEIRLTMPDGSDVSSSARPYRPDPVFEDQYRRSLVNYEQGRMFRVPRGAAAPSGGGQAEAGGRRAGGFQATSVKAAAPMAAAAGGAPRYKILVSKEGIYRLDYSYLSAKAPEILALDPRTLILRAQGVEVPISIRALDGSSGEADGRFDTTDVLEFYGRRKTEPPTVLNYDFGTTFPDVFAANDFTDTQVYWLSSEAPPHLRTLEVSGAPTGSGYPVAADFEDVATWEENNIYLPLEDAEPFFSIPSLLAGSTQATRDLSLALPGLAPVAYGATVTVRLRGGSSLTDAPDHRTRVTINNDTSGGADYTWDGEIVQEQSFTEPQSLLSDPTTIHLGAPGLPNIGVDRQYPDRVTVRYRRRFAAQGDALAFSYPNQDVRLQISGISGAGATIYEVSRTRPGSNEADPTRITGAVASGAPATYTFDVPRDTSAGAPATRSFFVAGPSLYVRDSLSGQMPFAPDDMLRAADPVLQDPSDAADLLVIAARGTVDTSPGGALDNLLAWRLSSQGLTSRIVYIDQVYDEFSFGLRDANAVRSFLAYAFDNWKGSDGSAAPPAFVLLAGDATPDYKNLLNRADWVDQVPTPMMFQASSILGYYSSDNYLASFRGADQVPDIFLGRISTRSAAASAAVFDKIRRYEQSPPAGLWKGRAILVAGDGHSSAESSDFESVQSSLTVSYFSSAPYSSPNPPLYFAASPWNGTDAAGFKTALINELNGGAAVLSYIGHGAFDVWGLDTFFTTQDAVALSNAGSLPFMVNINCLAGGFHYLVGSGSLGEAMTNNPVGGAVATFAPSGLSNVSLAREISDDFFAPLFGRQRNRLLSAAAGDVRAALWSQGSIIDLQSFAFLGDPATRFASPDPPPPTGLSAVSGNAQVTLAWTAPSEAVSGYRIYRAAGSPTASYSAVACDPLTSTSCVDRSVLNATTYYYYAVSLDAEGFWGSASNLNTGCDAGPDCVVARPNNPGAPTPPTGLTSHDPGSGGRLDISWRPNPETDIKSYTLYYGTVPGQYSAKTSVPGTTASTTLAGLIDSVRYYMALSATNTSGHESALSTEIADVPHLIQGIAPPRAISDLMMSRSGSDLVLSWTRPSVDIYGRPTTVVSYKVYRGGTPGFQPFAGPPLATIASGSTTTYTDIGAATASGDDYYIVTAIDSNGLVSGAGRELPNGVSALALSVPSPGVVRLSWPAVATDMQGLATVIDHYQVHVGSKPLSRASLGASTLFMDNVRALSVDLSPAGSLLYFSVIAVDDRGNLSPF